MRTVHLSVTRKTVLVLTSVLLFSVYILYIQFSSRSTFVLKDELQKPDRQQNETLWEYPALAFPRASMIDVQYQMPDFGAERRLAHPLGIKETGDWSQDGQSLFVDGVLRGQERGFYVEVGADDGEGYSNSLFFERFRAWSGVLIEPNQESFAKMKQLNRRALLLNTCVSPSNLSEPLTFVSNPFEGHNTNFLGGISSYLEMTQDGQLQAQYEKHFAGGDMYTPVVQTLRCSPLVDLLPDFVDTVDYLSLDTEGSELGILESIPFDEIDIKLISVDVSSITGIRKGDDIAEFMTTKGYKRIKQLLHDDIYQRQ